MPRTPLGRGTGIARWSGVAAAAATAVALAGGAAALADVNDGDVIHACVNRAGKIRVVEMPSDCRPQEEALTWNRQGPQGETGPAGPQGPPGLSGHEIVQVSRDVPGGFITSVGRICPLDDETGEQKVVLGGGFDAVLPGVTIIANRPLNSVVWAVDVLPDQDTTVTVYAVCANSD